MDAGVEEDQRQAEIFDALSHPSRIMILKALSVEPLGFADLKKRLNVESSGHLQHHLTKLGDLVKTDSYGKYLLSDQGKDALHSVEVVEKTLDSNISQPMITKQPKKNIFIKTVIVALVVLLAISVFTSLYEYNQLNIIQTKNSGQSAEINQLQTQLTQLQIQLIASSYKNLTFYSPIYNFSPPVPEYQAFKLGMEHFHFLLGGGNRGVIANISLNYYEFANVTRTFTDPSTNKTITGYGYRVTPIDEVTQPVANYDPLIIRIENNGTLTYRYVWRIEIGYLDWLKTDSYVGWVIPPCFVDAATSEIVNTGII